MIEYCKQNHKGRTGLWVKNGICNDCGLPVKQKHDKNFTREVIAENYLHKDIVERDYVLKSEVEARQVKFIEELPKIIEKIIKHHKQMALKENMDIDIRLLNIDIKDAITAYLRGEEKE